MKKIHENSLRAYHSIKLGSRQRRILQIFHITGRAMTDREIKEMGKYNDLNDVRPRITELVGKRLIECGKVKDVLTGRNVRLTRIMRPEEMNQPELF